MLDDDVIRFACAWLRAGLIAPPKLDGVGEADLALVQIAMDLLRHRPSGKTKRSSSKQPAAGKKGMTEKSANNSYGRNGKYPG